MLFSKKINGVKKEIGMHYLPLKHQNKIGPVMS